MLLRLVEHADMLDIFHWRNDPLSRLMSNDQALISLDDHTLWFEKSLFNPSRVMFIGMIENEKIGVCRFDYNEGVNMSEVSINLNPLSRGRSLAFEFLASAIMRYRATKPINLMASIKKQNKASLTIFERCGFRLSFESGDAYSLILDGVSAL